MKYEGSGDRNKTLVIEKYLIEIRPSLKNIINDFKKLDTWKVKLIIAIDFMSSKDQDGENVMHSKTENIEIINNSKVDEVVEELSKSLLSRYQIG